MSEPSSLRVTLLLGGETGEREVSIVSGLAVAGALHALGHTVTLLDPASGLERPFQSPDETPALQSEFTARSGADRQTLASLGRLRAETVDLVANLLHGGGGEGGQVAAILELAGLAYFGSGPAASAIALDKVLAKKLFRAEGIPVAKELLWGATAQRGGSNFDPESPPASPTDAEVAALGGYPIVAKPICGGSTIGLTIVERPDQWSEAWRRAGGEIDPERGLLLEEYIPGRELTVGLLEERALAVVEIAPKSGFYDYRRKYTAGETVYHVPAPLPEETTARLRDWSGRAFAALGCRDMGRADFRLAPDGRCACLEVNTIPGMTATSLLPKSAAAMGISFSELVACLCRRARERAGRKHGIPAGR